MTVFHGTGDVANGIPGRMATKNSTQTQPTIDVVIPVYNGQDYIIQAITSVEQQSYPPEKIVMVDDGSTDRTAQLVRSHTSSIPLTLVQQARGGPNAARNRGIRQCASDYVAFLDADDAWYGNKLAEQITTFQTSEFPNLGVVYCQYDIMNDRGMSAMEHFVLRINTKLRGSIFETLLVANTIASSASGVLVKRSCFERVGLFDENLTTAEDWDMWLRLAQVYAFDYTDKTLVRIRRHGNSAQNDELRVFSGDLAFYNKWLRILPETTSIPREWVRNIVDRIFARLPKLDFLAVLRQRLSPPAQQRLRRVAWRRLKLYVCVKVALLPVILLRNAIKSAFR